jgi:hypothetical protein
MLTVESSSKADHRLWLNGIIHFAPGADISRVMTNDLDSIINRGRTSSESKRNADSDNVSVGSGNSRGRRDKEGRNANRKDHRKEKHRSGEGGATSRLHGHIRREDKYTEDDDGYQDVGRGGIAGMDDNDVDDRNDEHRMKERNLDAYISKLPKCDRGDESRAKNSSNRHRGAQEDKSSTIDDSFDGVADGIDIVNLNSMNMVKSRTFRAPRALRDLSDDNDSERETSGLDDSDLGQVERSGGISDGVIEDYSSTIAEEKSSASANTNNTPPRNEASTSGRIRKAMDVYSPEDAKRDAKGSHRRPSVDEMIKQRGISIDTSMDDDKENELDIRAEKNRYAESKNFPPSSNIAGSRPPTGPQPYVSPSGLVHSADTVHNNSSTARDNFIGRSNTPPKQPGDPGIAVDRNFVHDDWDSNYDVDESPMKKDSRSQKTPRGLGGNPQQQGQQQKKNNILTQAKAVELPRIINGAAFVGGDVNPDADWLEADFDD